jgi:hypothetical protein
MSCRLPSRENFECSRDAERGCPDLEVIDTFGKIGAPWKALADNAVGILVGFTLLRDLLAAAVDRQTAVDTRWWSFDGSRR